ncbi:MAG: FHA domain-containing protein [Acidimicrobiales bacterium]
MPESLLTALKAVFLGLLYLFFFRVIRAVWVELREPRAVQVAVASPSPQPSPRQTAKAGRGPAGSWAPGTGGRGAATGLARLVVLEPPDRAGQSFPLGEELTLGRALGCGISLPDDTFVSTLHARVFRRDGSLYVEDLGSTNGTFVNDRPVTSPIPLGPGDRLQVGRSVLEVAA